jgi:hypothetical protein
LTDLLPERLVTKPMMVLRLLRDSEVTVDMAWDASGSGGYGRRLVLLAEDGLEAGDVLAERAQLVGLLDLAGHLAHAGLEEGFADLADLARYLER